MPTMLKASLTFAVLLAFKKASEPASSIASMVGVVLHHGT
jgi:hypothetical protein